MDSELQVRYNRLEKAARKVVEFKPYMKHSIFCSATGSRMVKLKSCECGLADLRALIGEKNVRR